MGSPSNSSGPRAAPVLIAAGIAEGAIRTQRPDSEISALVSAGRIVILKGAFAPKQALEVRTAVARWGKATAPFPHGTSPSAQPALNYHRIDDGRTVSSLPHFFHQICFNNLDALAGDIGRAAGSVAELMRNLQNRLADTNFELDLSGLRIKVLRYPRGGGYLSEHAHPREPQRIGLITSLSRVGEDFHKGGTTFRTPLGFVDTNESHDLGDIIVFRYDLVHGVRPVDEEEQIDWTSESGKWSMLLDLRETHGASAAQM